MQDFEKLGAFYLGRRFEVGANKSTDENILYDSKDLTTHAVVVGMTGSGKTGLCIDLLEEAGMDRIPAIVIDPKGDIVNLMLTFPELKASDFRPWIDESQAHRAGQTPDEFAAQESQKWSKGLASWDQDGARIAKFRDAVELQIYTPGSDAGQPVTILRSFAAPGPELADDSDAFRERITSAVSGLLALVGIDADPIRSREHILLSNILNTAWSAGRDLDLGQLIGEIQNPPFPRVGIMELDTFFPAKDRMQLAMTMNNLLASPSFSSWMAGEPLDIKRLLHTQDGKPRISIMSIAHLNDSERMFFVTILLNEILAWMRTQPGTSSLRAILYMDEVFGYFPPTANPPSKQPMLTLLKQARAFGLGVVLATQNPVDLDYKGLSNTGTWFLGRLQTERDKARVIEGLEGAAATTGSTFNRSAMEQVLAGLGSRRFLMNNVHEDQPVVFETRWAMSYLRGPLTRDQIQRLVRKQSPAPEGALPTPMRPAAERLAVPPTPQLQSQELLPADVEQKFVAPGTRLGSTERLVYRPAVIGSGRLHFVRASYRVDAWLERSFLVPIRGSDMPKDFWIESSLLDEMLDFDNEPASPSEFAPLPDAMQKQKNFDAWEKELKDFLYREQRMIVFKCQALKAYSQAEETAGEFKVRLEQLASEHRDLQVEKLRKKFASKFESLQNRIRRAEEKIELEESQYKQRKLDSILSVGSTLMGALLGRKTVSSTNVRRASTSMRSVGRASREKTDIGRAKDNLADLQTDFEELESKFNQEVADIENKLDVENLELEELAVRPRKSDISITEFAVVWLPWRVDTAGIAEPAF